MIILMSKKNMDRVYGKHKYKASKSTQKIYLKGENENQTNVNT